MNWKDPRGAVPRAAIVLVALLAILAPVLWWFTREVHITAPAVATASPDERPECPHSPWFRIVENRKPHIITELPLSRKNIDIPEFHDCQQFIADRGYIGLFAIYAADTLAFIDSILDTLTATPGDTAAVAGATIYSYTNSYTPLGIRPGFNCLYLSGGEAGWSAWLVPKGPDDPNCALSDTHVNTAPGVVALAAKPTSVTGMGAEDYPPVARWDWDAATSQQFIGIRCGAAWCEVSRSGTVSSPTPTGTVVWDAVDAALPSHPDRVLSIKGWHDAQLLALKSNGWLRPSTWGVIIPHPALFQMNSGGGLGPKWALVAAALVDQDYHGTIVNLMAGQANKIYLCDPSAEGGASCRGPDPTATCTVNAGEVHWWARVRNRQPVPLLPFLKRYVSVYHCVTGRPNTEPSIKVPGTARWRWLGEDETTWKRCDNGCCEIR